MILCFPIASAIFSAYTDTVSEGFALWTLLPPLPFTPLRLYGINFIPKPLARCAFPCEQTFCGDASRLCDDAHLDVFHQQFLSLSRGVKDSPYTRIRQGNFRGFSGQTLRIDCPPLPWLVTRDLRTPQLLLYPEVYSEKCPPCSSGFRSPADGFPSLGSSTFLKNS